MWQPGKWIWGILPLALMWFVANQFGKVEAIKSDLTVKAVAAANGVANSAPGLKSIGIEVTGRDVTLSGETLTADASGLTTAAVEKEAGIRLVNGALTVATAQKPYTWAATRDGSKVTLTGFVPDDTVRRSNVELAAKAFDGAQVIDQQKVAFGAPLGFATMTASALPELGRLAQGRFSLDDSRFCVDGVASSPENFLDLTGKMKAMPQTAFTLANCALTPPVIAPYVWGAETTGPAAVSLTGLYPSDEVRRQITEAARAAFPAASIADLMKPALGAPAGLAALAAAGLGDLSRLISGKISLSGASYAISGQGPADFDACAALKAAAGPAGEAIVCPPPPPPPPPPVVQAPPPIATPVPPPVAPPVVPPVVPVIPAELVVTKGATEIVVSGLAPSEAARDEVMAAARAAAPDGNARDATLVIRQNLQTPPDYRAVTTFGLAVLGRLARGEMTLAGPDLSVSGSTTDPEDQAAVEALLRGMSVPGARLAKSEVLVRPYELTVQADRTGAVISGYVPDAAAKSDILSLFGTSATRGSVQDDLRIVPGAPANFVAAAKATVQSLVRLDIATARLSEQTVMVQGMTCRDLIKSEVETGINAGQPAGFVGHADISLRQTGCTIDPPNTCQIDLDTITRNNAILFAQSRADLGTDPGSESAIREVTAILQKCPDSVIRIEGHTNKDGERYGYDNQGLSESRAAAVMNELVKRGIAAIRLEATGFGSRNPLLPHNTDEGRDKNRRVQFTVAKP